MQDIMSDSARFIVVMKGTQARITTAFMIRSIHSLIYGIYPQGVIYYFPSRDAVEDFSKTRFTPLINDNPCINRFLKSTDSVFVKKVGKSFLTLKGATATMNLKGRKKDSMAVRSTPADEAILDERDLFDQAIVDMIPDRLLNSEFKRITNLGSPTMPDFGISKEFDLSDQKNSMIKCIACGNYTCLAGDFPDSAMTWDFKVARLYPFVSFIEYLVSQQGISAGLIVGLSELLLLVLVLCAEDSIRFRLLKL
ncbi:unnamed protein product, partial [marine sediment metagenome]